MERLDATCSRTQIFLENKNIDIIFISESHFTNRSHLKIQNYITYVTQHPDGTAHGKTAIIIKRKIKHHKSTKYDKDYFQVMTTSSHRRLNRTIYTAVLYLFS